MQVEQRIFKNDRWEFIADKDLHNLAQLVFIFGSTEKLKHQEYIDQVQDYYPNALVLGCSTAGEIADINVYDDSLVVTAVYFEYTTLKHLAVDVNNYQNTYDLGTFIAGSFDKQQLKHLFLLSDGLKVNGTKLVKGLIDHLPNTVSITGGLSGDGDRFKETLVIHDDIAKKDMITAIGLYSEKLKVGFGSVGGWDPFGPERLITSSEDNILFELDGKSALSLYKSYLGEHAENLPASGLLFPLSLRTQENERFIVRTILSVDEQNQSMTFAGDMPKGTYARLMRANFDRLIDGATEAAVKSKDAIDRNEPDLAILISCVGRKMVLKQRTEEEIEAVREVLGNKSVITGFYSYGEISPFEEGSRCELHNQTMTVTTFIE